MDLIYMNSLKEDIGVLMDYRLDMAFGNGENDFECKMLRDKHCCKEGFILYCENTEYGGIIDDIGVDTSANEVTYYGRTWHGVLNSKVLEPDEGEAYLTLNGEANEVISFLLERMGLADMFKASGADSGIQVSNYKMNRYIKGYDGIKKMLKAAGAKLSLLFVKGFVEVSARPIIDYSKDEQFDTDQIDFKIKKKGNPLNHVICLGKGELTEREVVHVYADINGKVSEDKHFVGVEEVSDVYDNSNAQSLEELWQGGVDMITTSWNSSEIEFDFNADNESYDIGDIVGAKENTTGVEVNAEITKKIVKMENNKVTISYEVGE